MFNDLMVCEKGNERALNFSRSEWTYWRPATVVVVWWKSSCKKAEIKGPLSFNVWISSAKLWECHEIKCYKVLPYTHQTTLVWFHNSFIYLFLVLRTRHRISSHSEAWWSNPDHMAPSTVDCWTQCNRMSMTVAVLAIVFRCFWQRHSHSFKTNKQTTPSPPKKDAHTRWRATLWGAINWGKVRTITIPRALALQGPQKIGERNKFRKKTYTIIQP